jgi:hypothetical protein
VGQHIGIVPPGVRWNEDGSHAELNYEDYWYGYISAMAKDDQASVETLVLRLFHLTSVV